jgi:D-tyrosyl-tRNA(Tyr) deacylase
MRALIQRVSRASVTVDGQVVGQIGQGLLVLLGVGQDDSEAQVKMLVDKIVYLRIFGDDEGKMNRSLLDIRGRSFSCLAVHPLCRCAPRPPPRLYRCRATINSRTPS